MENNIQKKFFSQDLFLFSGITCGLITVALVIRFIQGGQPFFISYTFIFVLLGLVFEQKRLGDSNIEVFYKVFFSLCAGIIFFVIETQHEDFQQTDYNYFYVFFIFCFVILSIANAYFLKKNPDITIKITNGTLLLQLIAIVYLSLNLGLIGSASFPSFFLGIGVATFAVLIATNIFSKKEISASRQFFLSIFSSIITLILSVSYLRYIINLDFGLKADLTHKIGVCARLFLFGVSLVYNAENAWLLLRFIPGRGERRSDYRLRLRNLKVEHIARFQNLPLPITQILACVIIVGSYFYLNELFHWAPPLAAVWAVFLIYPLIAGVISEIFKLND